MSDQPAPLLPPVSRVVLALIVPIAGALFFSLIVARNLTFGSHDPGAAGLQLAGAGLASWLVGWRWYGLRGLGLRGGRPLYAGIGFAVLAWVLFLVLRLATVLIAQIGAGAGISFIYLLLFEAFCSQLWAFGLFFRSVSDWRGGLTAAVSGGLLFGAVGLLFFQEALVITWFSALYFMIWGVLYGIIRLRTGSLIGMVIVQAMQSWSAWQLFTAGQANVIQLRTMYLIGSALFLILIWRLWPRREDDYRI